MCWVKKELVDEGQNGDNLWKFLLHKRADVGDMFEISFCNEDDDQGVLLLLRGHALQQGGQCGFLQNSLIRRNQLMN